MKVVNYLEKKLVDGIYFLAEGLHKLTIAITIMKSGRK